MTLSINWVRGVPLDPSGIDRTPPHPLHILYFETCMPLFDDFPGHNITVGGAVIARTPELCDVLRTLSANLVSFDDFECLVFLF